MLKTKGNSSSDGLGLDRDGQNHSTSAAHRAETDRSALRVTTLPSFLPGPQTTLPNKTKHSSTTHSSTPENFKVCKHPGHICNEKESRFPAVFHTDFSPLLLNKQYHSKNYKSKNLTRKLSITVSGSREL